MIFFDWFNATEFFKQTIVLFFLTSVRSSKVSYNSSTSLCQFYLCSSDLNYTLYPETSRGRQCLESLAKRVSSCGGWGTGGSFPPTSWLPPPKEREKRNKREKRRKNRQRGKDTKEIYIYSYMYMYQPCRMMYMYLVGTLRMFSKV